MTTLSIYLFYLFFVLFLLSEWYVNAIVTTEDGEVHETFSSYLLEIGTGVLFVVAIFCLHTGLTVVPFSWYLLIGYLLILSGIGFRQYSIYYLGQYFSGHIRVREEKHELITTGPYHYFRHPSYFGSVLTYLGFGMATGSLLPTLLLPIGLILMYLHRTKQEEKMMVDAFGAKYEEYQQTTWGFLPFIR